MSTIASARSTEYRIASATPILVWMNKNFSTTDFTALDRVTLAKELSITEATINRASLVLRERGYLILEQPKTTLLNRYKLNPEKPLDRLNVEELAQWIYQYNQRAAKLSTEKVRAKRQNDQGSMFGVSVEPTNKPQQQPVLTPSQELQMTQEKPLPWEAQKSRSQQLQEQITQLQQEAQKEAQREAEEASKAVEDPESIPGTTPEVLSMLDSRIDAIEGRINAVVSFFEQASIALRGLATVGPVVPPIAEPTPEPLPAVEPTTRNLLVRLVNSYAAADRKSEHDTWKWLYGQFDLRKGFNVYAQAGPSVKGKDESYLAVVEQHGRIDELYKLARKLMTLPELR